MGLLERECAVFLEQSQASSKSPNTANVGRLLQLNRKHYICQDPRLQLGTTPMSTYTSGVIYMRPVFKHQN